MFAGTHSSPYLCACRDLPPSQGGKYVGFGSTPTQPTKKDDDLMANLSSVSIIKTDRLVK